ncbi:MAG TPA: DegT/DnrJ/EryC1/StrS family aminotransferase, partial [Solirubrobacterales bacterium]|nr:DegT/DnrJ/EryC1/StrS family aminotransferase [Solirubrobacterales bacterium]
MSSLRQSPARSATPIPLFVNRPVLEPLLPQVAERQRAVLESGRYILGPEVEGFEREFAEYIGRRHCIGVANGTEALTIALRALGIDAGDEVIVPAFTFFATAEAVVNAGGRPSFADVDPGTSCITATTAEARIGPRTRAIVPVHLFGNPAPMTDLLEFARSRGLLVVEDAAQAAGARVDGTRAGALGDAGCFSFYPGKNLPAFGDAG